VVISDQGELARLRAALVDAGYTVDGCLEVLGPLAYAALSRNETVPALRASTGGSPRETLIRLFLLHAPVKAKVAARALPLEACLAGGLLERDGDQVRASLAVRPYGEADADWYVVSDLAEALPTGPARPLGADHVPGIGGASSTLAQLTVRPVVDSALDLGTGCGVQALHLSRHTDVVTATDTNQRALDCAQLTFALSGVTGVRLVAGDMFQPVRDRRFDLVVSNPPFVISPDGDLAYRDSGLPGDEVCRRLVERAPAHLAPGGWCQVLANWLHVRGQDWRERLAGWVTPTGLDAWVVQREVQDPAEYTELWLRDAGDVGTPRYAARYEAWSRAFEDADVEGIGFGWITLHASGAATPYARIEEITHQLEQPLGPHVWDWFARRDLLRERDDAALLDTCFRVAPDARLEEVAVPDADAPGWVVSSRRVRLAGGLRRGGDIDPVGAEVLAAADGSVPLSRLLDAVAAEHGIDPDSLRSGALGAVRGLVEEGMLVPEEEKGPAAGGAGADP
jgi:SAM-dependent methyltransferase